jgi:hypothetical protein
MSSPTSRSRIPEAKSSRAARLLSARRKRRPLQRSEAYPPGTLSQRAGVSESRPGDVDVFLPCALVEGSGVGSAAVVVGRAALGVDGCVGAGRRAGTAAAAPGCLAGTSGRGSAPTAGSDRVGARMADSFSSHRIVVWSGAGGLSASVPGSHVRPPIGFGGSRVLYTSKSPNPIPNHLPPLLTTEVAKWVMHHAPNQDRLG